MSMQDELERVSEPFEPFHIKHFVSDSYSRMLDHEVAEWEQPYGYDIRPLEPMEFEKMEHSYDKPKRKK